MTPPIIETERLRLRGLCAGDFPAIAEFYKSDRSSMVGGPATEEQSWRFLAAEIGHWTLRGYGRWGVEEKDTGKFCGVIGLWNPNGWPEPELGWDLMNGFEGKGYATEAALAARNYAYSTLEWPTLISLVVLANTGSAAVAKRLGATKDGQFTHARFGTMDIYRHPAPETLT
jgi:RimJ/RimL family protein N-acetyltransferase